jgi:hypothetical protein
VSIHADDEFNLKLALDGELDDVTPRAGLADLVITRYRKGRRRRFAGVVGLFVVFVGIGVPVGIATTSGSAPDGAAARSGPVLRLGSYTLTLPDRYHLSDTKAAPCATGAGAARETAAVASGVCVLMFFLPPAGPGLAGAARPGLAGQDVPRGARLINVGRYRAWFAPSGYLLSGDGPVLVPTALVVEADDQDLVIGASGLSRSALVSLVSAGLSAA